MNNVKDTFKLNNGYKIPCIGFGTWKNPDGETAIEAVKAALTAGYRHIDTAAAYENEKSVGIAIKESEVPREEIFVTSKLWNTERGYDTTIAAFNKTLSELQLEYLDLYLIHWPASKSQFENWEELNIETWRAMTHLYKEGKIKSIGVSNFMPHHLKALMASEIKPMVNQIEYHPGVMQDETVKYCMENDILVEAWSPLGNGQVLSNETLQTIAAKYNKSVAKLCIRWALQNGCLPLPKSVTPSRIIDNTDVFDFEISNEDMETINNMECIGYSGSHPDTVKF